jgi:hypothetical protein
MRTIHLKAPERVQEMHEPSPSTVIEVDMYVQGEGSSPDWNPVTSPMPPVWSPESYQVKPPSRINSFSSEDSEDSYMRPREADRGRPRDTFIHPASAGYEVHGWRLPGSFRPSRAAVHSIHIISPKLLDLFRFAVQKYPGHSLAGSRIVSPQPHWMLAHYYKEFQSIKDGKTDVWSEKFCEVSPAEKKSKITTMKRLLDEATLHDLNVLLDYFRPFYTKKFAAEDIRHTLGFASYDLISFLFKPGTNVYAKSGGKFAGFIFEWGEYRSYKDQHWWEANCWNLIYNGHRIARMRHDFKIKKFQGEKQIESLPLFPSWCVDSFDGGKVKERLRNLGKKYYKILRNIPVHQYYQGACWDLEAAREGRAKGRGLQLRRRHKPDIVNFHRLCQELFSNNAAGICRGSCN